MDFDRVLNYDIPLDQSLKEGDMSIFIEKGIGFIEKGRGFIDPDFAYFSDNRYGDLNTAKAKLSTYVSEKLNTEKLKDSYTQGDISAYDLFIDELFGKVLFKFLYKQYNCSYSFPFFHEFLKLADGFEELSSRLSFAYEKLTPRLFLPLFQTYFKVCEDNDDRWLYNINFQREIAKNLMNLDCNNYKEDEIYLYCKPYLYTEVPIIWTIEDDKHEPVDYNGSHIICFKNEDYECKVTLGDNTRVRIKVKQNDLIFIDKNKGYAMYFLESLPPTPNPQIKDRRRR
jgi:hypothetical protein